ncbi:MAG: DUF1576 domain-containing protein [Clostridia bacterium]|nr:DUF1576 domain-containing protein [Clostridia bacterium]
MTQTDEQIHLMEKRIRENSIAFKCFIILLNLSFFIATPVARAISGVSGEAFWSNLWNIFTGPSKLVTDYFSLGCLASTLFNAGLCGLACTLIITISRAHANSTTFAAYLLVIAHCFYGLNFINMWPPFIGVLVYCKLKRVSSRDNLHIAMFSTALSPFISDFLFFYPPGSSLKIGEFSVLGIVLSITFGILAGFLVPALIPGTALMHRGYNMYKAGLAIGILGIFVYCFLYKTFGVAPHDTQVISASTYEVFGSTYYLFMNGFFALIFLSALLLGFFRNGRSFRNYRALTSCSGYGLDFADKFGMPLCLINFGVYGFCILAYLNLIFWLPTVFPFLPEGVGFTGPTAGVIFAALTFSADGQHPKNVAPIVLGYTVLFALVCSVCLAVGTEIPWALSTQAYINGLAFATGLCPIAGSYGFKYGVIAGLVSAIICTSTAAMHGGFVLYNGGFNAGLAAIILIPIFDFYKIKPKKSDDNEIFPIKGYEKDFITKLIDGIGNRKKEKKL